MSFNLVYLLFVFIRDDGFFGVEAIDEKFNDVLERKQSVQSTVTRTAIVGKPPF